MGRVVRLGVLGGTFDPPHHGHLVLAEGARDQLGLSRVLWVPAADPPHKQGRPITSSEHRLAMLEITLRNNPHFLLSQVDVDRPGPHYTTEMLALVSRDNPGAALYFLMGGDSLRDLPTWREPEQVIAQCILAVMERPGYGIDLAGLERQFPSIVGRVEVIDAPQVDLSATGIAQRVRAGRTIRYLVPQGVADYIDAYGLYRADRGEPA